MSYFFNPNPVAESALIFLPDHFALGRSLLFSWQVSYFFNPTPVADSALSLLPNCFLHGRSPLFSSQVSHFFNSFPVTDSALSLLPDHSRGRSPLFLSQVSNHPNHCPSSPHFSTRWRFPQLFWMGRIADGLATRLLSFPSKITLVDSFSSMFLRINVLKKNKLVLFWKSNACK